MDLLDLFRPRWRHSDASVRKRAVEALTDQSALAKVATTDADATIRYEAVERTTDQGVLHKVAKADPEERVRGRAVGKMTDQAAIADVALHDSSIYVRSDAVKVMTDQACLTRILEQDPEGFVRQAAVRRIVSQKVLVHAARNDTDSSVRLNALERVEGQECLVFAAKHDESSHNRLAAVERIESQDALADVARTDQYDPIRIAAVQRISDPLLLDEVVKHTAGSWAAAAAAARQIYSLSAQGTLSPDDNGYWDRIDDVVRQIAAQRQKTEPRDFQSFAKHLEYPFLALAITARFGEKQKHGSFMRWQDSAEVLEWAKEAFGVKDEVWEFQSSSYSEGRSTSYSLNRSGLLHELAGRKKGLEFKMESETHTWGGA